MTAYTAKAFGINKLKCNNVKGIIGQPVGVINDFNNESLKTNMSPVFIRGSKKYPSRGIMLVRVQPGAERRVLAGIYQNWQRFLSG